ncbi:MAG: DAK2 domain-containing protein [Eubacteriales bacterium]|nr:DAK2 domain-containing protein [Eubacteriales bacterium]
MQTIDAKLFQKAFLSGANRINVQKEYINELNVFPVPDGDTGTNMSMTIIAAANEVNKITDPTIASLCKAVSSGSLRGARGNSGVILSQLFRGFTKAVSKKEELVKEDVAAGLVRAVETAYKAVMKPKEGTILTVAKGVADKAEELLLEEDLTLVEYCSQIVEHGYAVLAKTPEMLPVLKEAGVVDSGGQGLMEVLQGCLDALTGKAADIVIPENGSAAPAVSSKELADSAADIKFGYCTEFIIMLDKPLDADTEKEFKKFLLDLGDSLVLVADDDICKVHVHTNHPGQAFEKALTFGQLSNMKVDNMRLEHQEKLIKNAEKVAAQQRLDEAREEEKKAQMPRKDVGFISVSSGEGLSEIFRGLGVDHLIEGGQTMNPSTEDVLNAIDQINADTIFVFPNNKNIILAAEQARDLTEDKKIIVVPTKTIPQGIASMIAYMPEVSVEENFEAMKEAIEAIATGQLTYAVRDTVINGKEIHNGDYMGIDDDGIQAVGTDLVETTIELLGHMVDEDESELISIYYGAEVDEEKANELGEIIEEKFPDLDVEVQYGGQPVYYYMISVE